MKRRVTIPLLTTCLAMATATGTALAVLTSHKPLQPVKPEEQFEYTDISGEYTPTIPPTEEEFDPEQPNDVARMNEIYFNSDQSKTIIKEDISGYLNGYINAWQGLSKIREWLQEMGLTSLLEWLDQFLAEYGLEDVGDISSAHFGLGDVSITPPNANVGPYKVSTTFIVSAKVDVLKKNEETSTKEKCGEFSLAIKVKLVDMPYSVFYSNNYTWMCGTGNANLKGRTGWSINPSASGRLVLNDGTDKTFIDEKLTSWSSVPTDPEELKIFEAVRKMMQWDSKYFENSNYK